MNDATPATQDEATPAAPNEATPAAPDEISPEPLPVEQVRSNVIAALRTIFDPEIPVNIYDLGLIYDLDIDAEGKVEIRMTLTAPACPVAGTFPNTVECRINEVPGVSEVRVDLVWEPPWTMARLTEDVKLQLGLI